MTTQNDNSFETKVRILRQLGEEIRQERQRLSDAMKTHRAERMHIRQTIREHLQNECR